MGFSLFDRFQIDIGIGWDLAIRSTDGLLCFGVALQGVYVEILDVLLPPEIRDDCFPYRVAWLAVFSTALITTSDFLAAWPLYLAANIFTRKHICTS
jgi:cyanate permease